MPDSSRSCSAPLSWVKGNNDYFCDACKEILEDVEADETLQQHRVITTAFFKRYGKVLRRLVNLTGIDVQLVRCLFPSNTCADLARSCGSDSGLDAGSMALPSLSVALVGASKSRMHHVTPQTDCLSYWVKGSMSARKSVLH